MIAIPDQPLAERILNAALARESPPQQLLLSGPPATGKREAARAVAWALIDPDREHPPERASLDLTIVRGTGALIRLDELDPVLADLAARPAVGRRRVFILEEAERLADDQGSRLLKMLEEPPPLSHVILVSEKPMDLLPTIRSRCLPVPFRTPGWERIARRLTEQGVPPDEAAALARADGPLALAASPLARRARALGVELAAQALAGSGGGAAGVREVQAALEASARDQPSRELDQLRVEAATKAGKRGERTALKRVEDQEKREVRRAVTDGWAHVLDGMAGLVADALAVCVGADGVVRHRDRLEALRGIAVPVRQPFLERAAEEVVLTRSELVLNPTTDLAVEALLLRIDAARRGAAGPLVAPGRLPY